MRAQLRTLWRAYRRMHLLLARRESECQAFVPHWEATWTDDVQANRVLNLALRPLRLLASMIPDRYPFSIVIVNWNSQRFLADTLRAVRRYSPGRTEVIVVDNASTDGSTDFLRRERDLRSVSLPWNIGHGPALDLGFTLTRGEFVASLDVDAFPVADRWLEELAHPIRLGSATVAGAQALRGYVHPCCLLLRRRRFLEMRHTFVGRFKKTSTLGSEYWDTGESISIREGRNRLALIERTSVHGPFALGATFGNIVFHNGCSTRGPDASMPGLTERHILDAWEYAVRRYVST